MRIIRPHTVGATALASNVPEDDAPAYSPSQSYAAGERCTFEHRVYEALQTTQGQQPSQHPGAWLDAGATNRWRMLDGKVGTATESDAPFTHGTGTGIQFELTVGRVSNGLALFEVYADTLLIEVIDPTDGLVYEQSINLIDNSGVVDYYSYCFLPIERKLNHIALDLPMYGTARIRVSLHKEGDKARCGLVVVGLQHKLGDLMYSPEVGIMDFSDRKRDEFGELTFLERDWSRNASVDVAMSPAQEDYNLRLLAQHRAKPLVWVGSLARPLTHLYGVFADFRIIVRTQKTTDLSLEVEGMT